MRGEEWNDGRDISKIPLCRMQQKCARAVCPTTGGCGGGYFKILISKPPSYYYMNWEKGRKCFDNKCYKLFLNLVLLLRHF